MAIHQEAIFRRTVANATQSYKAGGGTGGTGRKKRGFLDTSGVLPKGINASRVVAFGLGVALASAFDSSSRAADLIGQLPSQAPPSVAIPFDWSGFYVGGHVGYGRGYGGNTLFDPNPAPPIAHSAASLAECSSATIIGCHRACFSESKAISRSRIISMTASSLRVSTPFSSVTEKLDFVSTVRGRAGYAFDHWLFYTTGGFAWSQARLLEDPNLTGNEDKVLRMRTGWALGAGAELAIAPGWTARLEYLYDRLGKASGTFPSGTGYQIDQR